MTVRVTETATGRVALSPRVDGGREAIFELQDRLVAELVAGLRGQLPAARPEETQSLEAYEACSKGLLNFQEESQESIDRAIVFFERAVALDPGYARAHALLGAALDLKGDYLATPELSERALVSLDRALALRPDSSDAWRYRGSTLVTLDRDEQALAAFEKVSEWDLWRYYIPGVQLKRSFKSPLRKDTNPSASLFVATDGRILLKAFQIGTFNIWQFLQAMFNLTFIESLQVVDNDFNLGLSDKPRLTPPTMEYVGICTNDKIEMHEETKLPVKKRAWTKADEKYWGQFGLKVAFLQQHGIVPLQNYWVNDILVYWYTPYEPAYSIEFGKGIRKIYRPLAKRFKWVINVRNHDTTINAFSDHCR